MPSQPNETPAMDIRNAITLLRLMPGGLAYQLPTLDAIEARLWSAVQKLEAK